MANIDPATATIGDLTRLPPMLKQEAQNDWDAIITAPDITHARAEQVLAQQPWFSYTPAGYQIFSSGGSSGVRGVYVWDWEQFVTLACLAWRWQARAERAAESDLRAARLGVLEAGEPPHASTPLFDIAIESSMETIVIPAAAPFDQVQRAVADAKPTHLVGYASVIGRLARATTAGDLAIRPARVSTNSEPLSVEECVHWHTPMFLKGAPQLNGRLLRMAEAGMGPASFLMPEDLIIASRNQQGLQARTPEWLLLSRGLHREVVDAEGRTVSHVTDETTNRGFWRHFRAVMSEP